jgi:antitoxin YefM
MTTVTLDAAKETLGDLMSKAWENHKPVLITSDTSRPVVLVALDDFESPAEMDADTYLRRSPANVLRMKQSIAQLQAGNGIVKTLEELEAMGEA